MTKTFKVRPRPHSRYFFEVKVFDTFKKLYKYAKGRYGDKTKNYQAVCWNTMQENNCLGELLFSLEELSPEFVAHEVVHAVTHYLKMIPKKPGRLFDTYESPTVEEYTAMLTGLLVQQITNNLYELEMELKRGTN